jgi:transcriptional regulator with XRE-family HTH domain
VATNARDIGGLTRMIADEIRLQRQDRRWKQEQVSAATGIPVNTLSKIERAQTAIDIEQIEKIANAFGMLPEVLWTSARENARRRAARDSEQIYLPNGRINPAQTKGFPASDEDIAEILSHRDNSPEK